MTVAFDIDVLVVGLGPAGSRAAASAASAGHRVLATDRKKRPGHPVQCAEFVPAMLSQELDGLGAVTRQRIAAMLTYVEDAAADIKDDFPGRMIDRGAFDAALVARARDAGADCRFGVGLSELSEDGVARLTDGSELRPRLVVGADGPRSRVGRATGRVNESLVETRQVTVPLLQPHEATDIFLAADISGGYAWLFPKGAVANLGVGVEPAARETLKPLLDDLQARLVAEGRVGARALGHTGGAIPVGGMLQPVGLLGDVPVANPVTGAGIASAAISGQLAGEAAAAWLDGDVTALDDYAGELEDLFGRALARAVRRRNEILSIYRAGQAPDPAALRRGWIAYPEYWAA